MNRASPSELRKSLEAAQAMVKAGILFVPMPVLNEMDHAELTSKMLGRMETMAVEAEQENHQ
jgi:hypothetical protein